MRIGSNSTMTDLGTDLLQYTWTEVHLLEDGSSYDALMTLHVA